MAVDVPGAAPGSNLNIQDWQTDIEPAVYDKTRFLRRTSEKQRPYDLLNIRKITAGTGQIVAASGDGTGMVFDSMTPTVVTLDPNWYFFGHAFPDSLGWVGGDNIKKAAADDVERGIAAYLESQALALPLTLTNFVGNAAYDVDTAGFRAAVATLFNSGKVETEPGEAQIFGLLGALQHDDAMSIPEFTNAEQRGDGQNPNVSGVIGKGNGVNLMFSTLLNSDANGLHGVIWVKEAFGHAWNSRIKVETQRYLKQTRVMADAHLGFAVIHNLRACAIRTKTT